MCACMQTQQYHMEALNEIHMIRIILKLQVLQLIYCVW